MRTLRHAPLVLLLGACSPSAMTVTMGTTTPPADAGTSSGRDAGAGPVIDRDQAGSRLELRRWTTEDGTDAGHFFFDRAKNLPCVWYSVDANQYRCLPSDNVFTDAVRFGDPLCKRPVYQFTRTSCGQPPAFIREEAAIPTCPTSFTLRKLGAKLPDRVHYLRSAFGQCVSVPVPDGDDLYDFGDPVPLTDFVAAQLRTGPVVNRFAQRTLEGEDGSRAIFGFRDVAGQVDCTTRTAADGMFRCLPIVLGTMSAYSDNACTMPAGLSNKSACPAAGAFLSRSVTMGCSTRTSILAAGDRLTIGYQKFSTGCDTSTGAPFTDYWSGGDEVPPETFVAATLTTADGTARLRPRVIGTPAGPLTTESLWDSKRGEACARNLMSDGTYRCVGSPRPNSFIGIFADDLCTQPVLQDVADASGGTCPSGYYFKPDSTQCPPRLHVFTVDDKPFTSLIYRMSATGCVPAQPMGTGAIHLIGPELMPSEFAEVKPPAP